MNGEKFVRRADEIEPVRLSWGELIWLVGQAQTPGAQQTLGRVTIAPGQRNPLHRHPNCEELLYVLQGEAEHKLGDDVVTLKQGDVIRIPRGVPHWARAIGATPLVAIIAFSSADRQTENLEETGEIA